MAGIAGIGLPAFFPAIAGGYLKTKRSSSKLLMYCAEKRCRF
jgi:hypothetical protein